MENSKVNFIDSTNQSIEIENMSSFVNGLKENVESDEHPNGTCKWFTICQYLIC